MCIQKIVQYNFTEINIIVVCSGIVAREYKRNLFYYLLFNKKNYIYY